MTVTAHVENLTEGLQELSQHFEKHYLELALNRDQVPLSPQYEVYLRRDANGEVCYVALRDAGNLVGYFVGFVAPGLHYSTCLTCTLDIFWVHPEYRKGRSGIILFKAVENELKRRGVKRWFVGSKMHQPADALFEYLKFEPVEKYYSKWLGE